jgi:hypothetical protein
MDRDTGMKDGLAAIVGRRIAGVVVAQSPHGPRQQTCLTTARASSSTYGGIANRPPIPPEGPNVGQEIAIRSPWGSPPWKPSKSRQVYSWALTVIAIEKAKGG